jgi:DNA-binding transcriptional MerR regulator
MPKGTDMSPTYLSQTELAQRFRVSPRTLERWRWKKIGPNYIRLEGKVVYSLADIEAYERRRRAETHSSILGSWE